MRDSCSRQMLYYHIIILYTTLQSTRKPHILVVTCYHAWYLQSRKEALHGLAAGEYACNMHIYKCSLLACMYINMTNKVRLGGLRPGYMVDSKRQTAPAKGQSMSSHLHEHGDLRHHMQICSLWTYKTVQTLIQFYVTPKTTAWIGFIKNKFFCIVYCEKSLLF